MTNNTTKFDTEWEAAKSAIKETSSDITGFRSDEELKIHKGRMRKAMECISGYKTVAKVLHENPNATEDQLKELLINQWNSNANKRSSTSFLSSLNVEAS